MPILTYYIDSSDLESATSVYLNEDLTVLAPDGYYSNGTISRNQVDGILLPSQTCPSCP